MWKTLSLGVPAATVLAACATGPAIDQAAGFQVRADAQAPLNADDGRAAAPGAPAVIDADQPFRLRLAVAASGAPQQFRLHYSRNDGPWIPVEAHDFPLPERELELDFSAASEGPPPQGWRTAGPVELQVRRDEGAGVLVAEIGAAPGYALHGAPWPLDAFSLSATVRMPEAGASGFALVFGYEDPQNHARAEFDGLAGRMRLVQVQGGAATILAEADAPLEPGAWFTAEVQGEDGVLELEVGDGLAELAAPRPEGLPAEALGFGFDPDARVEIAGLTIAGEARTPPVSIVSTSAYAHGAAAAPLFSGAGAGAGLAVSAAPLTPVWTAEEGTVGEVVWPLVIRRFADGAVMNEAGDRFTFKMVDTAGAPAAPGVSAAVTLRVPPGHLGGVFVETPGRIGPWRARNGDLYFIMEPAETDNLFMMVKSEDGGESWREVDGANRPATGDLEAVDARRVGETVHILHQITEQVVMHSFNLAGHPHAPDRWVDVDTPVADLEAVSQMATLAARADGGQVAVMLGDRLYYSERPPGGAWSEPRPLDPGAAAPTVGPQAIAGPRDTVHIAYADAAGALWLRTLGADGALSPRTLIADGAVTGEADYGAVLPLALLDAGQTLVIAYRLADGALWERRLSAGTLSPPALITPGPVITNAVDSQQAGADLIAHGDTLHALFIDADTRAIRHVRDCGGGWGAPRTLVDAINGSWIRAAVHPRDQGEPVLAYVYDAGSNGGSGMNRYAALTPGACP